MAMGFVILKDWDERPGLISDASIVSQLMMKKLMEGAVSDGMAIAANPPPIRELGNGGVEFYLQDRNGAGHEALLAKRNELIGKIRTNPMFSPRDTRAAGLEDAPQLKLHIDRETVAAQGVNFSAVRGVLASALGGTYVNDFPNNGRLQKVMVQAEAGARMQPEQILALTVPNNQGKAVPLSTFMSAKWVKGREQSVRFNGYPAMKVSTAPASGFSSGQAMAEIQRLVNEIGGGNYSVEWDGKSARKPKARRKR